MLKNATRYIERQFQDENGLPPAEEEEYVQKHKEEINQIAEQLNSKNGQRDLNYKIRELSGGFKTVFSTTETFAQAQQGEIGGFTWNKRRIQFCDTFLVLMEYEDLQLWYGTEEHNVDDIADYIFLCDPSFQWTRLSKTQIAIENRSRKLTIQVKDEKISWDIIKCLNALKRNFTLLNQTNSSASENGSFSPIRHNTLCRWLVCGQPFMDAVADAMEAATDRIMIADWQLSPCVYLKRPWCERDQCYKPDDYWRLDKVLERKAKLGVRIYILIYQDPSGLGLGNYEATKYFRRFTRDRDEHGHQKEHGNIFTLTHPDLDGPIMWAHHEKIVVIDERVAFVSGIDLARGRWEIHGTYPIFDNKLVKTFLGNDYWNQFNTKPNDNVVECKEEVQGRVVADGWKDDRLDRQTETRSPWHDIGTALKGPAAHDVGRHFIERWNACIYQCFKSAVKLKAPGLRRFRIPTTTDHMLKQVMVPSLLREVTNMPQNVSPYQPSYQQPSYQQPPYPQINNIMQMPPMAGQGMANFTPNGGSFANMAYVPEPVYPEYNPESIPLPGTNITPHITTPYVGPRNDDYHMVSIQVLRSSTTWSAGLSETEQSIYKTYEHLIKNSRQYVYVENQFFVTAAGENKQVKNQIGKFLAERIIKAHRNNEQFKIYVVIPCVPGMNGRLEENTAAGQEVIIHLTFESICRKDHSIMKYCEDHGVPDWSKYIYFASFRTTGIGPDESLCHEIVYPHSKLLIVDDEHTIIGSANINDRSMLGERDSEVAVVIHGREYAKSLRIRIWSVAMGKTEVELSYPTADPSTDLFFTEWIQTAKHNFDIFDKVFCVLPNNTVFSMPDSNGIEEVSDNYKVWKARYDERPQIKHLEYAKNEVSKIRGTLVEHPLDFLKEETKITTFADLLKNPSVGLSKEGLAQWLTGHLFE